MTAGIVEAVVLMIVGAILYCIGRYVPIETLVNKILMVIGLILLIIGTGLLIYLIIVGWVL